MSSKTIDRPVTLRAPLPNSQEPFTVPADFPTVTLEALLARGWIRLDEPKAKSKKETE